MPRTRRLTTATTRHPDRVERAVKALNISYPFTTATLVESVAALRGKPIVLVGTRTVTGPCGLLVATPNADYVFYDATAPVHGDHVVAHELGHLVLDHRLTVIHPDEPGFGLDDPQAASKLGRIVGLPRSEDDEAEAELFATLVLAQAVTAAPPSPEPVPGLPLAFAVPGPRIARRSSWSPLAAS